jgi:hypothetical protein
MSSHPVQPSPASFIEQAGKVIDSQLEAWRKSCFKMATQMEDLVTEANF